MARKGNGQRRRWLKRQREWLYLEHFLAVQQWQPQRILEGQDDGHEPDFTLWLQGQVIGVELTTLPRLRDQMGNHQLRSRRLYWWLMRQLGWPFAGSRRPPAMPARAGAGSEITQTDIDAVLHKKKPRISHYRDRRPLDQLWLLIHTDAKQPEGPLTVQAAPLQHDSTFDQVWLSRYPLRQLVLVQGLHPAG